MTVLPLIAVVILYLLARFVSQNITLPPCLFFEITGLYCPGCGETRAVNALLDGNILLSLRQNVLVIGFLVVSAIIYIETVLKIVFEKEFKSLIINYKFLWIFLSFLLVYSVARNFIPQIAPV